MCVLGVGLVCFSFGKRRTTVPHASASRSERHRRREGTGATLSPCPTGVTVLAVPCLCELCAYVYHIPVQIKLKNTPPTPHCFISVLIASLKVDFSLCALAGICAFGFSAFQISECFGEATWIFSASSFTGSFISLLLLLQKDKAANTNMTSGYPEINHVHV